MIGLVGSSSGSAEPVAVGSERLEASPLGNTICVGDGAVPFDTVPFKAVPFIAKPAGGGTTPFKVMAVLVSMAETFAARAKAPKRVMRRPRLGAMAEGVAWLGLWVLRSADLVEVPLTADALVLISRRRPRRRQLAPNYSPHVLPVLR